MSQYFDDPMKAVNKAKLIMIGSTRKQMQISKTPKGYRIIDPRDKVRHYGQIVAVIDRPKQ